MTFCSNGTDEAVEAIASEIPEAFPDSGNIDAWTHGLQRMLASAALRTRMGDMASLLADATSWGSSADRHAAVYESALIGRRGNGSRTLTPS